MKVHRSAIYRFLVLLAIGILGVLASSAVAQSSKGGGLFVVTVDGKRGYIDRAGKIKITPAWYGAGEFYEGLARVFLENDGYKGGYIDTSGKLVIPLQFDSISDFKNGIAIVGIGEFGLHDIGDHKFGFIDRTGKWILEPTYRSLLGISEGLAAAMNDQGKWGFIDVSGKVVIPFQFEWVGSFSEGLAPMYADGKYGYIDKTGKVVIAPVFSSACEFSEALACVKLGGIVIDPRPYATTLIPSDENAMHGYIDKTGKLVLEIKDAAGTYPFRDGLARIEKNNFLNGDTEGFINKKGEYVIDAKYGGPSDFHDGLKLSLQLDGSWGWIDRTGKTVITTKYSRASEFRNGLAEVCEGWDSTAKCGYIDRFGHMIWKPTS